MNLNELKMETRGKIKEIKCQENIKRRLLDLGFIKGTSIKPVLISPLGEPRAFEVRGTLIAIRKEDTEKIEIEK